VACTENKLLPGLLLLLVVLQDDGKSHCDGCTAEHYSNSEWVQNNNMACRSQKCRRAVPVTKTPSRHDQNRT
jgi:hypothetical protein